MELMMIPATCCCPVKPIPTLPVVVEVNASSCCNVGGQKAVKKSNVMELVCRVALGIFSAIVNPIVGAAALALGAITGLLYHSISLWRFGQLPEEGLRRPVCAQGYMETLSGMAYSQTANQLATAAFIAMHIQHHPCFFVPFTGFFVGMWTGGELVRTISVVASSLPGH